MRFDGQAVVITGFGKAGQSAEVVARAFGERGAALECVGRTQAVHERVAELRAAGFRATAHTADLTDHDATAAIARAVAQRHNGRVAAVAALAGGFAASGSVAEGDDATYARLIAINLTTARHTVRAFLPLVRAARGAFVFVTSAATQPGGRAAGIAAYAAAKGALVQFMRALAQEEAEHGVRANAVAPTAIRTATNLETMGDTARYVEREEFAAAIVLLCTPALGRVTGQVVELR